MTHSLLCLRVSARPILLSSLSCSRRCSLRRVGGHTAIVLNRTVDYKPVKRQVCRSGRTVWAAAAAVLGPTPSARPRLMSISVNGSYCSRGLAVSGTCHVHAGQSRTCTASRTQRTLRAYDSGCGRAGSKINDDFVLLREAEVLAGVRIRADFPLFPKAVRADNPVPSARCAKLPQRNQKVGA